MLANQRERRKCGRISSRFRGRSARWLKARGFSEQDVRHVTGVSLPGQPGHELPFRARTGAPVGAAGMHPPGRHRVATTGWNEKGQGGAIFRATLALPWRRARSAPPQEAEPACKPGSVRLATRQSFLSARRHRLAPATYPGTTRAALSFPYSVLLRVGFTVPCGVSPARGALLPHPFTLT